MKNKKIKIVCTVLLIIGFLLCLSTFSMAELVNNADSWGGDINVMNKAEAVGGGLIKTIQTVGSGIAIIMLACVAIKYMTAAPAEKAEYKKTATAYIVGAVVLFACSNLISIIATFAKTNITIK